MTAQILIVMGVCGCGKTTLGEALAERLHLPFVEGDEYHPRTNVEKMAGGEPLSDDDRWPWLDAFGAALADHARRDGGVVGACSALRRVYRERLEAAARLPVRFVCLTGDREEIAARMSERREHFMPVTLLDSQLAILEVPGPEECAAVLSGTAPLARTIEQALEFADAG